LTIKEYISLYPEWNIYDEYELKFAEPDNQEEAIENIKWVKENCEDYYICLAIVISSYYVGTIDWGKI